VTATTSPRSRRLPAHLGPSALLVVSLLGLLAVIWGALSPAEVDVVYIDAGPVSSFEIGRVDPFPEHNFYVVGLADGRLRVLDGRISDSECSVRWLPDDRRGIEHNPRGRPGVFEDPCSDAVWSMVGNAISGTLNPMLTPHADFRRADSGELHVFVEIINPGQPR
jgi:hypothetical protein